MGITAAIQRWWADQSDGRIYSAIEPPIPEALVQEVDISAEIFDRTGTCGSWAGRELSHLLQALNLNPDAVSRSDPDVMREMTVACVTCRFAARCQADLCNGVAQKKYFLYCPNADTIDWMLSRGWKESTHI
jgi:hypothetical protein